MDTNTDLFTPLVLRVRGNKIGRIMVDFAAHFTIHARLSEILHFTWKVLSLKVVHLPIASQSEHCLPYLHLDRISTLLAIDRSSSHTLLAAEKRFGVA